MEISTPNQTLFPKGHPSAEDVLEAQVREIFARTVYSHKTHEKCADQLLHKHNLLKTSQIVLSAIATGSLLLAVFGDSRPATLCGAFLSTILFGISAYTKDYDFGKVGQKHADTAHQLWGAREDYLSLLTDLAGGLLSIESLIDRRNHLQQRLDKVYASAPRTHAKAYAAAQKALQVNEDLTFSDQEIDAFLPVMLRRTSRATGEVAGQRPSKEEGQPLNGSTANTDKSMQ